MRLGEFVRFSRTPIATLLVGLGIGAGVAWPKSKVTTGMAGVRGCGLYYEVVGEGALVVLIHGGQLDRRMWDDQFPLFAQHFKVVRYDVRGYGRSEAARSGYSDEEDLGDLLRFLGIERAHIVGLSLGGRIAVDFALSQPSRVASLVLAGPGLGGFGWSSADEEQFGRLIAAARDDGPEAVTNLWLRDPLMAPAMDQVSLRERLRQLCGENAHAWLNNPLLRRRLDPPAIGRLAEIHVPTLLIVGSRDAPSIQQIVGKLEAGVRGARKVVIPGAGHMVNMEKPDIFNRTVLGFLQKEQRN